MKGMSAHSSNATKRMKNLFKELFGDYFFSLLLGRRKKRLLSREVLIAEGLVEGLNGGRGSLTLKRPS